MSIATKTRTSLAGAAALIALATLAAPSFAADKVKEEPGRCYGINTCKGTSLCATAKNDCKGLNECKGQGVLVKTPTECKALGGTLTEKK
ncbi:BufA2 family periplasmic bufferin-type metallophore [Pseudoduganella sp. OTU4001]|uniref:BufA2 family periplasmic bufferin-type metallophore n=1 Tax=Pseudoduganella sp. OTU4001 TaxID=3043854 RepID=UPI00313AF84F